MGGGRLGGEVGTAARPPIQRKTMVSPAGDAREQDADDAARRVVHGLGAMTVQSAAGAGMQARPAGGHGPEVTPAVEQQVDRERGSGAPLPGDLRRPMERSFGADFRGVRVHTGPDADRLSHSLGARAFTTGHDVFFRSGELGNTAVGGPELLAHELAHVVQQRGARRDIQRQATPPTPPAGGGGAAPPARVVYIDANVIIQVNRGNQDVANALRQMRASGTEVRIAPFQYNELVVQPEIPRTATAQRLMLEEMNIRVGAAPTLAQRIDVTLAGQTGSGGNIMQIRDRQLVSSARADGRTVEIWSMDTPFTSNPRQVEGTYGVRVAPESQLPVARGQPDYRVGRQLLGLEPVQISLTGQVTRGTPPGGGGTTPRGGVPPAPPPPGASAAGTGASGGARVVAGGLALIVVLNEILGGVNRVRSVQQRNIDMGEARLAFWEQFGARPVRGVWDQNGQHPLPAGTVPETSVFGSPSFPYVADIDVATFRRTLPSRVDSYQDFLYFLDAAKALGAIQEEPPMPDYPTRAQKAEPRRYYAWVNQPDRANRRRYDITDVVVQVRNAALGELDEAMREQTRSLSPAQQAAIYRLKRGSETRIYRSAGGLQPIHTAQQIFGPDPWVRTIGRREDVGGWFSTDMRALVVPANADAQRAALVSGYWVKQPIEDTLDEVREGGRPILDRQPAEGPVNSFVAGPEPGSRSRFGRTRYYRHWDPGVRWTVALGELREFWVKVDDLEPVPHAAVTTYARSPT